MNIKNFFLDKKNQTELLRFVIVGVICTLVDLGASSLIQFVIYPQGEVINWLSFSFNSNIFVAALVGFILGVITNYILSIIVVFKNVENKTSSRSVKGFILFFILSAIGFLINYSIREIGNAIYPMDNNYLWFLFVFGVATFVVLIYNYVSRKLILFRAPKENIAETTEFIEKDRK